MADEVSYQSLYRKYRPQSPGDVVGQDHVVRALVGAIGEGRLSHAFLFCGPRGTGKTSTARILAKMVNCEKGPTAEPCGVCEQCVRIREGTHLDVVEIDAASHGGVDDARELRERAPTAPAQGREKVYIIDEAQRLSTAAFDALLKLFEEPPQGVRFVLATTEPHKMPATIVGRCQRFDFRRIPTEQLADLLQKIASQEGTTLTRAAAEALARQAEGSARDAESLLDQSLVLSTGEVTEETVSALIGVPMEDVLFELADAVALGDTQAIFELVHRLVQGGQDIRHFTGQTLSHFRDLLIVQSAPEDGRVLEAAPEVHARLAAQAGKFTPAELARVLSLLVAAQTDMRWSTSPRLTLELALIRATIPEADPASAGLSSRIERLERLAGVLGGEAVGGREGGGIASAGQPPPNFRSGDAPAPADRPARASARASRSRPEVVVSQASVGPDGIEGPPRGEDAVEASAGEPHAPSAGALDVGAIRRSWRQLLSRLQERKAAVLKASLELATPATYDGSTLELAFPPGKRFAMQNVQSREDDLRNALGEVFGVTPRITCVEREAVTGALPSVDVDEAPVSKEDALAHLRAELGAELEDDGPEESP